MNRIQSILIVCRQRPTNEEDVYYCVGYGGVTKINHCIDDMYQVLKGDKVIANVDSPDEIRYFEEE